MSAIAHEGTNGPYTSDSSIAAPAGADFLVVVAASYQLSWTPGAPTWNGTSLTQAHGGGVNYARSYIWYLQNPDIGTYTLAAGSGTGFGDGAWAIWFSNALQSGSPVYHTAGSGSLSNDSITATVNIETSTGDLAVWGGAYQEGGGTWYQSDTNGVSGITVGYGFSISNAATESGQFGKTGVDDRVCCFGVSFKQTTGTTYFESHAGSLTPSGALARGVSKTLAGSVTPSGTITRKATRDLNGVLTIAGTVTKKMFESLAGAFSMTGGITKKMFKSLAGAFSMTGGITKKMFKSLAGAFSMTGGITKKMFESLAGAFSMTGGITKKMFKSLAGAFSMTGGITKKILIPLTGAITFIGNIFTSKSKMLAFRLDDQIEADMHLIESPENENE